MAVDWQLRKTLQKGLNTSPLLNFSALYCITQSISFGVLGVQKKEKSGITRRTEGQRRRQTALEAI
jgi:CRISPR/Cas system-associated protein Cas7 (RAMP superfamily)